jgi:hypothetical protein
VKSVAARSSQSAMRDDGMELGEFCLKLLINQQKRLQRAANIAIASGHDFIDGAFM